MTTLIELALHERQKLVMDIDYIDKTLLEEEMHGYHSIQRYQRQLHIRKSILINSLNYLDRLICDDLEQLRLSSFYDDDEP
jgi:hypothetical protein